MYVLKLLTDRQRQTRREADRQSVLIGCSAVGWLRDMVHIPSGYQCLWSLAIEAFKYFFIQVTLVNSCVLLFCITVQITDALLQHAFLSH